MFHIILVFLPSFLTPRWWQRHRDGDIAFFRRYSFLRSSHFSIQLMAGSMRQDPCALLVLMLRRARKFGRFCKSRTGLKKLTHVHTELVELQANRCEFSERRGHGIILRISCAGHIDAVSCRIDKSAWWKSGPSSFVLLLDFVPKA